MKHGKLTTEQFANEVAKDLKLSITPDAFMENFVTWIVGTFPDTFDLLDAIPNTLKVAALSNISHAHWQEVEATGLTDKIKYLFLSHQIGHLKPSPASFQHAVDGLGFPAEEIIFFDDTIENVHAANAFGLKAHQVLNPTQEKAILNQYKLL